MQMRFAATTGLDLPISPRKSQATSMSLSTASMNPPASTVKVVEIKEIDRMERRNVSRLDLPKTIPGALMDTPPTSTPTSLPLLPTFNTASPKSSSLARRIPSAPLNFRSHDNTTKRTLPPQKPRHITPFSATRTSESIDSLLSQKTLSTHMLSRKSSGPERSIHSRSETEKSSTSSSSYSNNTPDRQSNNDSDSPVSFAPSPSGGKNIATWFSGLLGR
ncbi:hypothetical protein ACJQWK_04161 [Exserohilum turcicum]